MKNEHRSRIQSIARRRLFGSLILGAATLAGFGGALARRMADMAPTRNEGPDHAEPRILENAAELKSAALKPQAGNHPPLNR